MRCASAISQSVGSFSGKRLLPRACSFAGVRSASTLENQYGNKGNIGQLHQDSLDADKSKVQVYAQWAATFDADVAAEGYDAPAVVTEKVLGHFKGVKTDQPLMVLDAGCGTGLVGAELLKTAQGVVPMQIVGCDISVPMVVQAREKGYSSCFTMDLNFPMTLANGAFDAATCAGTFIQSHVGPDPLLFELCRTVKPGGIVVATVRRSLYDADPGYAEAIERLKNAGHVVSFSEFQYLKRVTAMLVSIEIAGTRASFSAGGASLNLPSGTGLELPRQTVVRELVKCMGRRRAESPQSVGAMKVLDAVCGMGETGAAIAEGFSTGVGAPVNLGLRGFDLSPASVEDAPPCYQDVQKVDAREPLRMYRDGEFDGVVCIGAFAPGSVVRPSPLVEELVRVTQPGGTVIFTADRAPHGGRDSWLEDYAAQQEVLRPIRDAGHHVTQVAVQVSPSGLVTDMVTIQKNSSHVSGEKAE